MKMNHRLRLFTLKKREKIYRKLKELDDSLIKIFKEPYGKEISERNNFMKVLDLIEGNSRNKQLTNLISVNGALSIKVELNACTNKFKSSVLPQDISSLLPQDISTSKFEVGAERCPNQIKNYLRLICRILEGKYLPSNRNQKNNEAKMLQFNKLLDDYLKKTDVDPKRIDITKKFQKVLTQPSNQFYALINNNCYPGFDLENLLHIFQNHIPYKLNRKKY